MQYAFVEFPSTLAARIRSVQCRTQRTDRMGCTDLRSPKPKPAGMRPHKARIQTRELPTGIKPRAYFQLCLDRYLAWLRRLGAIRTAVPASVAGLEIANPSPTSTFCLVAPRTPSSDRRAASRYVYCGRYIAVAQRPTARSLCNRASGPGKWRGLAVAAAGSWPQGPSRPGCSTPPTET